MKQPPEPRQTRSPNPSNSLPHSHPPHTPVIFDKFGVHKWVKPQNATIIMVELVGGGGGGAGGTGNAAGTNRPGGGGGGGGARVQMTYSAALLDDVLQVFVGSGGAGSAGTSGGGDPAFGDNGLPSLLYRQDPTGTFVPAVSAGGGIGAAQEAPLKRDHGQGGTAFSQSGTDALAFTPSVDLLGGQDPGEASIWGGGAGGRGQASQKGDDGGSSYLACGGGGGGGGIDDLNQNWGGGSGGTTSQYEPGGSLGRENINGVGEGGDGDFANAPSKGENGTFPGGGGGGGAGQEGTGTSGGNGAGGVVRITVW